MEPSITIPEDAWQAEGDYLTLADGTTNPRQRLQAYIVINGIRMCVEAYAVDTKNTKEQRFIDSDVDEALGLIVCDACWPVATTEIAGREYALVATPCGT